MEFWLIVRTLAKSIFWLIIRNMTILIYWVASPGCFVCYFSVSLFFCLFFCFWCFVFFYIFVMFSVFVMYMLYVHDAQLLHNTAKQYIYTIRWILIDIVDTLVLTVHYYSMYDDVPLPHMCYFHICSVSWMLSPTAPRLRRSTSRRRLPTTLCIYVYTYTYVCMYIYIYTYIFIYL